VSIYVFVVAALMLGAIAPSFGAWDSIWRSVRALLIFAMYPLFFVMAITHGVRAAGQTWIAFAAFGLVLELVADARLAPAQRLSLLLTLRNAALLWPLTVPATVEHFLVLLGVVEPPPPIELPAPPRGDALVSLSDDEMLIAVHQLLSAEPQLTSQEKTILLAESFNREVHAGGFLQWFSNTDSSVPETVESLGSVGAEGTAALLRRAAEAASSTSWTTAQSPSERRKTLEPVAATLHSLDDDFFALERREDLTSLIAQFLRQHRSRCPVLDSS
jgi:hypothetical protein